MSAPKRIEAVFRLLLPPACREYVLGDLCEKCHSTREYLREAILVVGPVIIGRIRRTTDAQLVLMETISLYLSFPIAAWYLGQQQFLYAHFGFGRLAIPTAIAIIGLLFCNAWSDPERRSVIMPIVQTAASISFALFGQAVIFDTSSSLAVPPQTLLCGSVLGFLLVSTLRVLFQPSGINPTSALLIPVEETTRRQLPQKLAEQSTTRPAKRQALIGLAVLAVAALLAAPVWHDLLLRPQVVVLALVIVIAAYRIKSR